MVKSKRSLFKIFWKTHCCIKLLFIKLDNSSFGYLLVSYFGKSTKFEPNWANFKFDFFKMSNIEFVPSCSLKKSSYVLSRRYLKKKLLWLTWYIRWQCPSIKTGTFSTNISIGTVSTAITSIIATTCSHSSLLRTFGLSATSTYDSYLLLTFGTFAMIWGHFWNVR